MLLKRYLNDLVSRGKHFFSIKDLKKDLGVSDDAIWSSIARLKKKGEVASLVRGYYMIIPPEYSSLGSLPPEQFIDHMMSYLGTPYYVGLLSAARRYGAAHQQPLTFQVVVSRYRKPIRVGRVKVKFVANKYLREVLTREFFTPRGKIIFSSPESTAIDLVTYPHQSGGLSNVLTVLEELLGEVDPKVFKKALTTVKEIPIKQRLGYLLDRVGREDLSTSLYEELKLERTAKVPLDIGNSIHEGMIDEKWNLLINTELESDL